jgi:hypothetical protein
VSFKFSPSLIEFPIINYGFIRNPEVLRDRDLSGELKDVWSAVQNFRDRERAAVSDLVVYTEFGPESTTTSVDVKSPPEKEEPKNDDVVNVDDTSNMTNNDDVDNESPNTVEHVKSDNLTTKINNSSSSEMPVTSPTQDVQKSSLDIEKLSISSDAKKVTSTTKPNEQFNQHNNESSEKIVKIQNQKNKEASFLPKFLTSNKDKDKDKEKEKEKDETEHKVKTKKSLIFFRRNKSTTSSPTHAPQTDKNEDDN